jgi:hypothetical protein
MRLVSMMPWKREMWATHEQDKSPVQLVFDELEHAFGDEYIANLGRH